MNFMSSCGGSKIERALPQVLAQTSNSAEFHNYTTMRTAMPLWVRSTIGEFKGKHSVAVTW